MRKTDGSPVVRLGEGGALGFSPDDSQVLALMFTPMQIRLYPIGTGDPVTLSAGPLKTVHGAQFFPDGKRVLACGDEPSGALRCYALDLAGGPAKAFMPEGLSSRRIAPDGQSLVAVTPDGTPVLFRFNDQKTQPLPGITRNDDIVGWSDDSRAVFAYSAAIVPSRLDRVDVSSGARTLVRELAPPDRAGLLRLTGVSVIGDGRGYAYGYWKRFSKLFLMKDAPR